MVEKMMMMDPQIYVLFLHQQWQQRSIFCRFFFNPMLES